MHNSAAAQCALGMILAKGRGHRPREIMRAATLWRVATEQGHLVSIYNLGRCFELGEGAVLDRKVAAALYTAAAEQVRTHLPPPGYCVKQAAAQG